MRELCERARVPQKPARFLRRAHAALLAASGVDPKSLQKRMGHSQVSTTLDIYAYALNEADRRAAEMVDRALGA
jgi:integrase